MVVVQIMKRGTDKLLPLPKLHCLPEAIVLCQPKGFKSITHRTTREHRWKKRRGNDSRPEAQCIPKKQGSQREHESEKSRE